MHTEEQRAIIAEAKSGESNILINALAGCAKTTTLLAAIEVMPQKSVLFAAFNKGIAEEAEKRLPKLGRGRVCLVQTLHAIGRQIIVKALPNVEISKEATEELVDAACRQIAPSASYPMRRAAVRLVRCAKETLPFRAGMGLEATWAGWRADALIVLGYEQGIFGPKLTDVQIDRIAAITGLAINLGATRDRESIDFCDMVWLPLVLGLPTPSKYQAIVADEVQDVSVPQLDLLQAVSLPTTRLVAAGDDHQQIYAWRGSLGKGVWPRLEKWGARKAKRFDLTITFRCSKAVVRVANEIVPQLKAATGAEEGAVLRFTLGELPYNLAQAHSEYFHTFVLSRTNKALIDCALFLWREGVRFTLNAGQQLLDPLFILLASLDKTDEQKFKASLDAWHLREATKADKAGAVGLREEIDEQREMLLAALKYAHPTKLRDLLTQILKDNNSGVKLSTVHKVKGLEAERVFLLKQTFARHTRLRGDEEDRPIPDEELNIEYVGITRGKTYIGWVNIEERDEPDLLETAVADLDTPELEPALELAERAVSLAHAAARVARVHALRERTAQILDRLGA